MMAGRPFDRRYFLLPGAWLLLLGCVGSAQTSATRALPAPASTALIVSEGLVDAARRVAHRDGRLSVVIVPDGAPSAGLDDVREALATVRRQYFELNFADALSTTRQAQLTLEREAREEPEFALLAEAWLLRGMNELALGDAPAGHEAIVRAARLRPDLELSVDDYPPNIRELFQAARTQADQQPPASLTVTTEPAGARVSVDGRDAGTAPLTLHATSGRHYVRVEALGFESRMLTADFRVEGGEPLSVLLPRASRTVLLQQLLAANADDLSTAGAAGLVRSVDAERVLVARITDEGLSGWLASPGEPISFAEAEGIDALVLGLLPVESSRDDGRGVPTWVWVASGAVVAAGAGVAIFFATRADPDHDFILEAAQ